MITQYEVGSFLRKKIPQLSGKVCPSKASLEVYTFMNYFSDYTRHAVEDHNYDVARKCFALAERLLHQGDRVVRMLIENVFVFTFTSFMPKDKTERLIVKCLIPDSLYHLYIRQVMQSGC